MPTYFDKERKTWTARYRVKDPVTGKYREHKKRGFKYKREAQVWESEQLTSRNVQTLETFKEMAARWEESEQATKQTSQKHRENFEKRFSEYYEQPIRSITKQNLVKWRSNLASNDSYSTGTKNQVLSFVKSVFRFSNAVYDIPDQACTLKPFKKTDNEILQKEMKVWTPEQFQKFENSIPPDLAMYRIFFELLFWTGMRRGEAIALNKIDICNGWINVHRSWRTATEGFKPTKTKESRRVKLDPATDEHIQTLMELPGSLVFGGAVPLSPTTIKRIWDQAIKDSGVPHIRIHDLRHSHATWLINNGVNIVAVSKRLGHSSIDITLKTYTHLLDETDQYMMEKITSQRNKEK